MRIFLSLLVLIFSFVLFDRYAYAADFDYRDGFFDNYADKITSHNIPYLWTDDDVSNSSRYPRTSDSDWRVDKTYTINFVKPLDFTGVYLYIGISNLRYLKYVKFYDSKNVLLRTVTSPQTSGAFYTTVNVKNVKKVEIYKVKSGYLHEFELFVNPASLYSSVSDISTTYKTHDSASFKWKNPSDKYLTGNKVYLNDKLLTTSSSKIVAYTVKDLQPSTKYKLTVSAIYNDVEVFKEYEFTTSGDVTPPSEVKSLKVIEESTNIKNQFNALLAYFLPTDKDFSHVVIYRDGVLLKDNVKSTEFVDTGLKENTEYVYTVYTVDTVGNRSEGVSARITIYPDVKPPSEVQNLKVMEQLIENRQFDALVSYQLPIDKDFSHLVVYRDGVLLHDNLKSTQFVDMGLNEKTKYVYTVYTVDIAGNHSKGVSVQLVTSAIPDLLPPDAPKFLKVIVGNASGRLSWMRNTELDLAGYNVYLNGKKVNTSLVKPTAYSFRELINNHSYNLTVTAVDSSGNESPHSVPITLIPQKDAVPSVGLDDQYDLNDMVIFSSSWFSSLWWIIAFTVGTPLAYMLGRRIKELFVGS